VTLRKRIVWRPLVCALLAGCAGEDAPESASSVLDAEASSGRCVEDFSPDRDYFPAKAEVRYAEGFSVSYHGHYKVLRTHPPLDQGGGTDIVVLLRCGTPAPPIEGDLAGATVVEIPARTAAANEDLSLTRMRLLGLTDRVVGMAGGGIYDPGLRGRWERGDAVEIGASFHGPPRFEVLLEVLPDVTFLSTASLRRAEPLRRARELNLGAAPSVSWVEPTLLGQAEWLHQVAVFFDREGEANTQFDAIEERYAALVEAAAAVGDRPTLLWLDPSGQGDRWVVPEANWQAKAVVDAGGRTPWGSATGEATREVTSEEILALGDSIDFVLTESVALDEPGSGGVLEHLPAFREGRVFSVHRRARPEHAAYDWYESAVVEVDRVLEDLVALLHPELRPEHRFHHLRPARPPADAPDAPQGVFR